MDLEHIDSLLASRLIPHAQHANLISLVERGVTDPCTDPEVTPGMAQLWYKHSSRLSGEGPNVLALKTMLVARRTKMRDDICTKLGWVGKNPNLDAYIGSWLQLEYEEGVAVDFLSAVVWKYLEYIGESPAGRLSEESLAALTPALTVEAARDNPAQLMMDLQDLKKRLNESKRLRDDKNTFRANAVHIVDSVALKNGWWKLDDVSRTHEISRFTIESTIAERQSECITFEHAFDKVSAALYLSEEQCIDTIDTMIANGIFVEYPLGEEGRVIAPKQFDATAKSLISIVRKYDGAALTTETMRQTIDGSASSGAALTDEQALVYDAMCSDDPQVRKRFAFVCAAGGTGKSEVCARVARKFKRVLCLAPTWKAVENLRLRLPANVEFKTIQGFVCNPDGDDYDVIVLDETSMAISSMLVTVLGVFQDRTTQILAVGDDAQLPAILRGNLMSDLKLITAPFVLTKNMRTEARYLVEAATGVRNGGAMLVPKPGDDAEMHAQVSVQATAEAPVAACGVNAGWVCTPWKEDYVQIITHTNATVKSVNAEVQSALGRNGTAFSGCYIGDVVRIIKNTATYKNGMEGILRNITTASLQVSENSKKRKTQPVGQVELRCGTVIDVANYHMEPGFACTVHKSQGSEYDNVVVYLTSDTRMTRPLFYTAITRAKKSLRISGRLDRMRELTTEPRLTIIPYLIGDDE